MKSFSDLYFHTESERAMIGGYLGRWLINVAYEDFRARKLWMGISHLVLSLSYRENRQRLLGVIPKKVRDLLRGGRR
jgi:hypothetical protein